VAKILREIAKLEAQSAEENGWGEGPLFPLRRSGLAPSSGISTMKAMAPLVGRPVTESFRERATSAPKYLWQQG
jgi:hypothetical protein